MRQLLLYKFSTTALETTYSVHIIGKMSTAGRELAEMCKCDGGVNILIYTERLRAKNLQLG